MQPHKILFIFVYNYRAKNEIKRLDKIYAEKTAQFNELLDVCASYIAASKVRELLIHNDH